MSAGKSIEIKIAAVGAEAAAAELQKTADKIKSLDQTGGSESRVKAIEAEIDSLRQRGQVLDELSTEEIADMEAKKQAAAEYAEELEAAGKDAEGFSKKTSLAGASMAGLAIGGAIFGKTLGEIAKGFASIDTDKLREVDAAMADQIDTAKTWAEVLTDPMNGIQRLISGSTINEAFAEVNEQLARNAQMQAEAVNRMIEAGRATAADLKAIAAEIAAANAILDAKDSADAKERDVKDAARIRAGEAPEDVAAERAAYDRDKALEAVNRGLDVKGGTTQAKFDDAQKAEGNRQRVAADPRATREDQDKASKEADDAKKAFEDAKKDYDAAKAVAEEKRRGIRAEYEGSVNEAGSNKQDRLAKEAEKKGREEAAEAKRKEAEETKAARDAARETERAQRAEMRGPGRSRGRGVSEYGSPDYGGDNRGGFARMDSGDGTGGRGVARSRKKSAVEDGHDRAEARQRDREERADSRTRDREERGGREDGSLELRKRGEAALSNQGGNQDSGGNAELMGLMERLIGAVGAGGKSNSNSGGDYSALKRKIEILEQQLKNR